MIDYRGTIEFSLVERTAERAVAKMPVQPGILNPFGIVHAGATLWLADVCATHLCFDGDEMKPGAASFPLGVSVNASMLGNRKDGTFTATSVYVKKGRRLSIVRTTVTGDDGRPIADVTTSHMPAG